MRYLLQGTVTDIYGNVVPAVNIEVRVTATDALATFYPTEGGAVPDADSIVASGSDGSFALWLDDALYPDPTYLKLSLSKAGMASKVYYNVLGPAVLTLVVEAGGGASPPGSVSDTDICNLALAMIGQAELVDLSTDVTARAKTCQKLYPKTRDAVLRAYGWNCAMVYATLTVDATAPDWGFAYRFPLPSGCLRVLAMSDSKYRFKVVGRYLHTDAVSDEAQIRYTTQLIDPSYWDALLVEAVATRLSSVLCVPLTGDLKKADFQFKLYLAKLREARGVDGQEGTDDPFESTDLTDVR